MSSRKFLTTSLAAASFALIVGCASEPGAQKAPAAPAASPVAATAAAPVSPAAEARTEADAASQLERKFQEAAKGYKVVQKDGKNMYCKKEKVIGSTIPTLQCISEAQLRLQVEQMDDLRQRMRSGAHCTLGPGCSAGGG
jgi:Skp family chaperone for outer membrane proteins